MDRRAEKTKKAIRKAFIEILAEKRILEITVSELAKKADIDRRTFYLHYSAVMNISDEILHESIEELVNRIRKSTYPSLKDFINTMNDILMKNYDFYHYLFINHSFYSTSDPFHKILREMFYNFFFERSNMDEEIFWVHTDFVVSGILGMYVGWFQNPGKMTIEQFTDAAQDSISNCMGFLQTICKR